MNNYNINFECTYHNSDCNSDDIYRSELLRAFNIKCLEESTNNTMTTDITKHIEKLYKMLENKNELSDIFDKVRERVLFLSNQPDDFCFLFLFGYETFYIMHKLLKNYEENKSLEESIKELINKMDTI